MTQTEVPEGLPSFLAFAKKLFHRYGSGPTEGPSSYFLIADGLRLNSADASRREDIRLSDLLQMQRVDHRTLRLVGEFDISSTENVRSRLLESVGRLSPGTDLTLDLSGLRFIDCSGIHCLLQTAAALDDDGALVLLGPRAPVLRVLEMLRIGDARNLRIRVAAANEPAPYRKRSNVSSIAKRRARSA